MQQESLDRGTAMKLGALVDWNVLDLSRNREDAEMNKELVRLTRQYLNHNDSVIKKRAQMGLMLLQIRQYIKSPNQEFWPEISGRFHELLTFETNHPGRSRNFLLVADAISNRGLNDESQQLYSLIDEIFSKADNGDLASIGQLAGEKIVIQQPGDQAIAAMPPADELAQVQPQKQPQTTDAMPVDIQIDENELPPGFGVADSPTSETSGRKQQPDQSEEVESLVTTEPDADSTGAGEAEVNSIAMADNVPTESNPPNRRKSLCRLPMKQTSMTPLQSTPLLSINQKKLRVWSRPSRMPIQLVPGRPK